MLFTGCLAREVLRTRHVQMMLNRRAKRPRFNECRLGPVLCCDSCLTPC